MYSRIQNFVNWLVFQGKRWWKAAGGTLRIELTVSALSWSTAAVLLQCQRERDLTPEEGLGWQVHGQLSQSSSLLCDERNSNFMLPAATRPVFVPPLMGSFPLSWVSPFLGSWWVWAQEPAQTCGCSVLWEGRDGRSRAAGRLVGLQLLEAVSVPVVLCSKFYYIWFYWSCVNTRLKWQPNLLFFPPGLSSLMSTWKCLGSIWALLFYF